MRLLLPTLLALVFVVSCRGEPSTAVADDSGLSAAVLARGNGGSGGGSGGGSTQSVTVTGASPAIAPTDTVLDVVITGIGFAKGASARWAIAGDTTQVLVLSNGYVNSTTLKARIAVPVGAKTGSYDIIVTNVGGKKGVGAEVFEVVLGDPRSDWFLPVGSAAPTVGLRGDGLYLVNGQSAYQNGVCGVSSSIFSSSAASGSGDAIMQTDNPIAKNMKCTAYPRKVVVAYADGRVDSAPGFFNVRNVQSPTTFIPIGSTEPRGLAATLSAKGLRCTQLRWNDVVQNGTMPVPADQLLVTRVDASTWHVQSRPYPNNRAYCMDDGAVYNLDVSFTIMSRTPPGQAM